MAMTDGVCTHLSAFSQIRCVGQEQRPLLSWQSVADDNVCSRRQRVFDMIEGFINWFDEWSTRLWTCWAWRKKRSFLKRRPEIKSRWKSELLMWRRPARREREPTHCSCVTHEESEQWVKGWKWRHHIQLFVRESHSRFWCCFFFVCVPFVFSASQPFSVTKYYCNYQNMKRMFDMWASRISFSVNKIV